MNEQWKVTGIDLAWGYKMPDAIATGHLTKEAEQWVLSNLELTYQKFSIEGLCEHLLQQKLPSLLAIDAPLLCKNETGARPVDLKCSALYRKHEAGCHPVNLNLVKRPLELTAEFSRRKVLISQKWHNVGSRAIEVYPHPTMIHWFRIEKTIKYKKGKVAEKRAAFRTYQGYLSEWLKSWPVNIKSTPSHLLHSEWTKENEDKLDAFFCLLIACWEVIHQGNKSLTLGDDKTGFIVIPKT